MRSGTTPHPRDDGVTLLPRLLTGLLVSGQPLQEGLDQVVQTETLAVLQILHHEVGKPLHMTGRPAEVRSGACQSRMRCMQAEIVQISDNICPRYKQHKLKMTLASWYW